MLKDKIGSALRWLSVGVLVFFIWKNVIAREAMPAGQAAPELIVTLDDGSTFRLSDHRDQVVVLNFWATYCPPCRAEGPAFGRVYQKLKDQGVFFVGVSTDHALESLVVKKGRSLGMSYPLAMANPSAHEAYQISAVPTTFVIDTHGKISWSRVGMVSESALLDAIHAAR